MKQVNWRVFLGMSLIALSAFLYLGHYAIFRDAEFIFIYLLQDIAFVPFQVLLVTLIIHQFLSYREKRALLKKMNMVIGAFFSEVGTRLLKSLTDFDPHADTLTKDLIITNRWTKQDFSKARKLAKNYHSRIDSRRGDLESLRGFLVGNRGFFLGLLENTNLLEHESFTELLWAVFHLTEELAIRADLRQLPVSDYGHLSSDMKRAYLSLTCAWLDYMKHLMDDYPYLFSLAIRTNPLDPKASPIVREA